MVLIGVSCIWITFVYLTHSSVTKPLSSLESWEMFCKKDAIIKLLFHEILHFLYQDLLKTNVTEKIEKNSSLDAEDRELQLKSIDKFKGQELCSISFF